MCGTKRCCRKCCPKGCCGFCKPPKQVQQQVDTLIHLKENVKETEIRYGFIKFYPGVCTSDNSYTCPMLAVHLYRHRKYNANKSQDSRTVAYAGRNHQQTHQGEKQFISTQNASAEEEVIMVPLEDVIQISYRADVKKDIQADIKSHVTPVHELSENGCDRCCAPIVNCCRKTRDCCCCQGEMKVAPLVQNTRTITDADPNRNEDYVEEDLPLPKVEKSCCNSCRCWCCRKKILVRLIKKTNTKAAQQAERSEAEVLCRTVMQLKGMKNRYPSAGELDKILDQCEQRIFGTIFHEPVLQLPSNAEIQRITTYQTQQ
ncbi:unnamed protein product [Adineta steineri]|uniref:Uncharacterized protein n=1 Tax=Adineta steineri TaxID=433720 RepID=A0A813VMH6_9BILA|nr:unnamed protein product [Adineta steineri]CAF3995505.1 unnamed protein product [Adineta steineri]